MSNIVSVIDNTAAAAPASQKKGMEGVFQAFSRDLNAQGTALNAALTAGAVEGASTDPTAMLKMQVALANYNIGMQVTASVVKALESTAQALVQKLGG